jgi:hypothetical protein
MNDKDRILKRLPAATSHQNLIRLLRLGIGRQERVRLMRIGTPREFRMEIIAAVDSLHSVLTPSCALLLDPALPDVEFLLADPFCEAFLERLDTEGRTNWQVVRIQKQILKFARGLLCLAERRREGGKLTVGFHRSGLIWNLGIVGTDLVQLRAYGKGTGHDGSVEELLIEAGEPDELAESFMRYYESVRTRPSTRWLTTQSQFVEFVKRSAWPDLYKGNAVFVPELEEPEDSGVERVGGKWKHPDVIYKICMSLRAHSAEEEWLSLSERRKRQCRFFALPKLRERRTLDWRGEALEIEHAGRCSLFEIASAVHGLVGKGSADSEQAAAVLGALVAHSIEALKEFRTQNETIGKNIGLQTYPYGQKLTSAFETCLLFLNVVSRTSLEGAMKEAKALGRQLEARATEPFRDAHLKNRLFRRWDTTPAEVARTLLDTPRGELFGALNRQVVDIDFETAQYLVTDVDDVAHVLFFENTGLSPLRFDRDCRTVLEQWAGVENLDEDILCKTMLVRSTREYLRRLWYARTMPHTYMERYELESRDYFLDLALWASERLAGWVNLKAVLRTIKKHADTVWDRVPQRASRERIEARLVIQFRVEFLAAISGGKSKPSTPSSDDGPVFVLDEEGQTASFLGVQMRLDPTMFHGLHALCTQAGRWVPHEKVANANANQCISEIRRELKKCEWPDAAEFLARVRALVASNADKYTKVSRLASMNLDQLMREFLKNRPGAAYRLHINPSEVDFC